MPITTAGDRAAADGDDRAALTALMLSIQLTEPQAHLACG